MRPAGGAVAHAPTVLANVNRIDRGESFLFYLEGWTERTIVIMATVEAELNALGTHIEQLKAQAKGKLLPGSELDAALKHEQGPVVIAYTADNAGGGAPSDSTFVL